MTASDPHAAKVQPTARPAPSDTDANDPKPEPRTGSLLSRIRSATPRSDDSGSATTAVASANSSPTSKPSDAPSTTSTKHFKEPKTVREFAGQTRTVATMVLNGELDIDRARTFSSLARTIAQTVSAEVTRSRFLQNEPDLTFEDTEYEDA